MKSINGLLLCFVLGLGSLFAAPQIGDTSPQERAALMRFYNATNGPNWKDRTRWGIGDPCNNHWKGITCSNTGILGNVNFLVSSIAAIELPNNNLTGYIPNDITNSLVKLQVLDLANNKIGGAIPQNILMLQDFRFLSLDNNQFTGILPLAPMYTAFGNRSKLEVYSVSNNQLSGSMVADYFRGLRGLTWLALDGNNLSGEFPSSASGLTNLKTFKLSGKNFTGQLPNFNTFPYLTSLFLYKLDLPDNVNFVQNLTNLEYLVLDDNLLTGNLSWIGNLKRLKWFSVSRNNISGTIPSNISTLTNLEELWLDNNNFNSSIPSSIQNLTKLTSLALHNNNSVYTTSESVVDFVNSKIDGVQHQGVSNYKYIMQTNSSASSSPMRNSLMTLYNSLGGTTWSRRQGWGTNASTCTWMGIECDKTQMNISSIDLQHNNLRGTIPKEIGNFTTITSLSLNHNGLIGTIPNEIGKLKSLKKLDLSENNLNRVTASTLGQLKNLEYLNLSENNLTSNSLYGLRGLDKIKELYLHENRFMGYFTRIGDLSDTLTKITLHNNYHITFPSSDEPLINRYAYTPDSSSITPSQYIKNTNKTGMESDKKVLSYLYYRTDGDNWRRNTNWLKGYPCLNNWYGITCKNGRVTEIRLYNNNLTGEFPYSGKYSSYSLQKITTLESLDLRYNKLYGEVEYAPTYTAMTKGSLRLDRNYHLTVSPQAVNFLNQYGHSPSGSYVNYISQTNTRQRDQRTYLGYLYYRTGGKNWWTNKNWLSKTVPPCQWAGIVCKDGFITEMNLALNGLSTAMSYQTIPRELKYFPYLSSLNLNANNLSGEIPEYISEFKNLKNLNLSSNSFSGNIPKSIGALSNLKELYLSNNDLSGSIPASITHLFNLNELYLASNKFSGSIPSNIGNLKSLTSLNLAGNNLSGTIPESISKITGLQELRMTHNCNLSTSNQDTIDFINKVPKGDGTTLISNYKAMLSSNTKKCGGDMSAIYYLLLN